MESESAQERFERLLDQLEAERGDPWDGVLDSDKPTISIEEDEDEYAIEFDMSAYDAETVSARVEDRTLIVTAERVEDGRDGSPPATADTSSHRLDDSTRRRYTAREEVAFPVPVEQSATDLTITNGVATVLLEKAERKNRQSSAP